MALIKQMTAEYFSNKEGNWYVRKDYRNRESAWSIRWQYYNNNLNKYIDIEDYKELEEEYERSKFKNFGRMR